MTTASPSSASPTIGINASVVNASWIRTVGDAQVGSETNWRSLIDILNSTAEVSGIINLNGSSDYIEAYVTQNSGGSVNSTENITYNTYQGFKLIGA